MRSDLFLAAVLLTALPLAAQTNPQTPLEREFRIVPTGSLTRVIAMPPPATRGPLIRQANQGPMAWGPAFPDMEPSHILEPDQLIELIRSQQAAAWETEGTSIRHDATLGLVLANQPAAVEAAAALVQDLTALMARRAFVEARLYAVETDPGLPVLLDRAGMAAAEQQLKDPKGARLLWSGATDGVGGECQALELVRERSFVGDYAVEVAEKSRIADPQMCLLMEGVKVHSVPHFTADGRRIALSVFVTVAQPAVIESFHPNAAGLGSLDRPLLDHSQLQASAVIEAGGGLALRCSGTSDLGGPSFVLLVRCTADEPGRLRNQGLGGWPLTALTAPSVDAGGPRGEAPPFSFRWHGDGDDSTSIERPLDPDHVIEMIREATPGSWEGERESMTLTGQHLLASNRPEVIQRVGAVLAGLEREVLETRIAEVTVLGIPDTGSFLESPPGAGGPQSALDLTGLVPSATVLCRMAVPLLSSREAFFLRGRESMVLADYEVEIASTSAQVDPVVERTFSGITGQIRLTSAGDEPSATVHLVMTDCRPARRVLEEARIGVLERESTSQVTFRRHHRFKAGEPLLLGEGVPLMVKGTAYRTLVQVSVRKG